MRRRSARGRTTSSGQPTNPDPRALEALGAGATLGRYRLASELGAGGMAVVYRAEDPTLRREVAIKILYPHLLRKEDHKARFLREARAAAKLDHPGILRIIDVGEDRGTAYIVMELLRGRSLKDFLEERGAPLAEACALIGATLADALAAAHRAGVVHRDVKPANVMISDAGRVVLCDFGVARIADDDAILTQSGAMVGTPAFMPPEQALGKPVDARSDVYALGATIYQLATGHLPVSGPTPVVLAAVTRGDIPPPLRRNPAIGVDLAKVITRAMARDPKDRYQTAEELRDALDEVASHAGVIGHGGERGAEVTSYFGDPGSWNERMRDRILAATMARAKEALAGRQVAKALALADRVLAIEPSHEEANSLVASVGDGATRWKRAGRLAALLALAAVAAGGVAIYAVTRPARSAAVVPDATAAIVTAPVDAGAVVKVAPPDAAQAIVVVAPRKPDAGVRVATPPRKLADAGVRADVVRPDAAPPVVAPPAIATLRLETKAWCDLEIDGKPHGRYKGPVTITAGKHRVRCWQPATGNAATFDVDLAANEERVIPITLLAPVAVGVEVSAAALRVDGARHANGARLKLTPGRRYHVELVGADGKVIEDAYVNIRRDCTLKDRPELDCYE